MKRKFSPAWFVLLLAAFVFGLVQLFQLRFDQGDIYPPSSSLRADPLGAKILFESLREIGSVHAERLYTPLGESGPGRGKTLFLLGLEISDLNQAAPNDVKELEQFARDGGRIVFSFQPMNKKTWQTRRNEKREQEEKDEKTKTKKKRLKSEDDLPMVSLLDQWKLKPAYDELEVDENGVAFPSDATLTTDDTSLPETLPWHTALCFQDWAEDWKIIYARNETNAVVLERPFGKGSLVFCSDSYLFSNEAMRKARQPDLLTWFIGPNHSVLFDETHLGVQARPGVAALARKYRLHGVIAGLFLLAGLFVWKNSTSFVPPHDDDLFEGRHAVAAGKESAAGFVNLLRRNISPAELLSISFAEWKKSGAHQRQRSSGKLAQMELLLAQHESLSRRERKPVQTYREISTLLTKKL